MRSNDLSTTSVLLAEACFVAADAAYKGVVFVVCQYGHWVLEVLYIIVHNYTGGFFKQGAYIGYGKVFFKFDVYCFAVAAYNRYTYGGCC